MKSGIGGKSTIFDFPRKCQTVTNIIPKGHSSRQTLLERARFIRFFLSRAGVLFYLTFYAETLLHARPPLNKFYILYSIGSY